jgi:hypothetical protein
MYVALPAEEIASEQLALIEKVMDLMQLPAHTARMLLQRMRWSYDKLAELYFEDPEDLLQKAGCMTAGEDGKSKLRRHLSREMSGNAVHPCLSGCRAEPHSYRMPTFICGHTCPKGVHLDRASSALCRRPSKSRQKNGRAPCASIRSLAARRGSP